MDEPYSNQHYLDRAKQQKLDTAVSLKFAAAHHIESFNFIYTEGLQKVCKYLLPQEIIVEPRDGEKSYLPFKKMKVWFEELNIGSPYKQNAINQTDARLFPKECRMSQKTYGAPLFATIARTLDDGSVDKIKLSLGDVPIMVRSQNCHLSKLTPEQLVEEGEDCNEFGGYFILNGLEKIVRLLILNKRNYPIGFVRSTYINRGPNFTGYAVQMKCVREDLFSQTITLHYVSDGNIFVRIMHRKQEFLIPIILLLKSLVACTDLQIYNKLVQGNTAKSEISDRVEVLLRSHQKTSCETQNECLSYLGMNFRSVINVSDPSLSDQQVGQLFLQEHICVHLDNNNDKFNIICLMVQKLYALVSNEILPDNMDSLVNQELLLPGHLYLMILKEKLEELLLGIRIRLYKDSKKTSEAIKTSEMNFIKKAVETQTTIGKKLEYFLATGNLKSQSGLDLMQAKGYAIIADRINNMRYLSHFRSVHRGAYFAEMKTTTVRKLLPEQWGFVCPVHTPDGHPCGLLNHISSCCIPLTHNSYDQEIHSDLVQNCVDIGMNPVVNDLNVIFPPSYYPVLLNGRIIGYLNPTLQESFLESLRYLKINQIKDNQDKTVPEKLEIGFVPQFNHLKRIPQYPGIYLATNEARMVRAVKHLASQKTEWISPFEQIQLSIAVTEEDFRDDTQYQEYSPSNMLSILAANVPLLGYNQSPRNMYQCQMAKQTMGTSQHNYPYRFDNKTFRINNPQMPIVKCQKYEEYGFDTYPSGTNAIVAVLSYTGYDMEDAMIMNKSSYERGFGHGTVYKSYSYQLNENNQKKSRYKTLQSVFYDQKKNEGLKRKIPEKIMKDGVPPVGTLIKKGQAEMTLLDTTKNELKSYMHKDAEQGYLDQVALIQSETDPQDIKFTYKIRINRNPVIGDKFSSRHGQKGVLGMLWPSVDMPFTESGLVPDVLINPNAFPSRMTIGMLIESMAGKVGAVNGKILETEPFKQYENDDQTKYFGEQLVKQGYNYYGNELMYSGIYGEQMKAEIFIGPVYYQRLRHMVSDKSQARSTGPVDVLTQQPVKGRKKYGGIRLGEMERDALLAHGISYVLKDRLMNCSDYSEGFICTQCGNFLSTYLDVSQNIDDMDTQASFKFKPICRSCKNSKCEKIAIPFVLRYLSNELAAMNVKMIYNLC